LVLWLIAPSIASAQDVMELDLAFKNGQLQRHASEGRQEGSTPQVRRRDTRAAFGRIQVKKRHVRR
jgi:hypothetical protein